VQAGPAEDAARPACRLACVNLSSCRCACQGTAHDRRQRQPHAGSGVIGQMGHAVTALVPGACTTRRVPGRYLRGTREVPGWRNPQASGGFDLCHAGAPDPRLGLRAAAREAGPLPGRREVNARSTPGHREVHGPARRFPGYPRETTLRRPDLCRWVVLLPATGVPALIPLVPAAGQLRVDHGRPGAARPWPRGLGVVRRFRLGPGCCLRPPGSGNDGACRW